MCEMWGWGFLFPTSSLPALGLGQPAKVTEVMRPLWFTQPMGEDLVL